MVRLASEEDLKAEEAKQLKAKAASMDHARRCNTEVPEIMFMCKRHWRMVPEGNKRELLAAYVPGQEIRKDPTNEYIQIAVGIVNIVDDMEGGQPPIGPAPGRGRGRPGNI